MSSSRYSSKSFVFIFLQKFQPKKRVDEVYCDCVFHLLGLCCCTKGFDFKCLWITYGSPKRSEIRKQTFFNHSWIHQTCHGTYGAGHLPIPLSHWLLTTKATKTLPMKTANGSWLFQRMQPVVHTPSLLLQALKKQFWRMCFSEMFIFAEDKATWLLPFRWHLTLLMRFDFQKKRIFVNNHKIMITNRSKKLHCTRIFVSSPSTEQTFPPNHSKNSRELLKLGQLHLLNQLEDLTGFTFLRYVGFLEEISTIL